MKKLLKSVDTQKKLATMIQRFSKDERVGITASKCGYLSVNEASSVAKVISNAFQRADKPYNDLYDIIQGAITSNDCKLNPNKIGLVMEIMTFVFRDADRWYIFSQSKKMMARVINNDKTPVIKA